MLFFSFHHRDIRNGIPEIISNSCVSVQNPSYLWNCFNHPLFRRISSKMEKGNDSITEEESDIEEENLTDMYNLISAVNNNNISEVPN